ncbi:CDP-glycerol glycerophosphotransferase family protein [Helicobacter burdigaliensis]|uniref:CDP-glycerol glycerophosphotransferase family protein n=1 Tax=Helicobacter burdigaliensis TaxID=2315334 RepID=UPI000EF71174|nr:CDP-glycerol glycerophosphotransferase family protein [Helicobacter burdigaliensis]
MRYFIYPKGVNGEGIGHILTLLEPKAEICFIDDNNKKDSLEVKVLEIDKNDLVLNASTKYYKEIQNKLSRYGISSLNGIEFCGKLLKETIEIYKKQNKYNFYIGIVISNKYIEGHFVKIDEELSKLNFGIIYFVFTKELYEKYAQKSFCVLAPHTILETIDNVDMMLLANGEPTHKNVVSVDFTHGFQGSSVYLFDQNVFDKDFFYHVCSCLDYRICGAKKIEKVNKECFEKFESKTKSLRLGYMKLSKDYQEYCKFLQNKKRIDEEFVLLSFTYLDNLEIYKQIIEASLSLKKKVVISPHPVYADKIIGNMQKDLKNNENVFLNTDFLSRFEMFARSFCLITDCSSMGYTYPLTTAKPTIVYTEDKEHYFSLKFGEEHYFDERLMFFCKGTKEIKSVFNQIELSIKQGDYQKKIEDYRNYECFNFYNAKEKTIEWIQEYFNNKEKNG